MSTAAMIESLTALGEQRSYEAGTVLCRQGEPSTEAYVVIDGSIELQQEGRGVRVRRADVEVLIDEIDLRD